MSPVWIMKAGLPGSATTLSIASCKVPSAFGLAGLSNPMWLSEICRKLKSPPPRPQPIPKMLRFRHAAGDRPQHAGSRPNHAFQRAAAVDALFVFVRHVDSPRSALRRSRSGLAGAAVYSRSSRFFGALGGSAAGGGDCASAVLIRRPPRLAVGQASRRQFRRATIGREKAAIAVLHSMFRVFGFTWQLCPARLNDRLGQSGSTRNFPAAPLSMGMR